MAALEEPWEEEGAVGAGGLPRYPVGSEVEVQMTDRGFHGAYYEGIIAARLPDSGGYEVVFSTLVEEGGGGPLREAASPANVRPRPPPPPGTQRCDLNVFDMVEAYHNDGWWPGVVSGAWPASAAREPRYDVSFPTIPEVLQLQVSLVRPRRAFVRGRWMDMEEVVPRVPLYDEGSSVEVIWHDGKQGTTWMTATIIKMVGSANYVVRHEDSKRSIAVLHSRYIRPQPIFDRMNSHYDWEPSAKVEVYHDGTWLPGVISDVGSCGSSKYAVRVKRRNNEDEENYTLVSSTFLRPCISWDGQERMLCSTKKHARKRKYAVCVEDLSPMFSTPGGDSDQNCSVPNKRSRTDNVRNEGLNMRHSLHSKQVTTGSSSKLGIYIEGPSDKHTMTKKKLDNENKANGGQYMQASSTLLKMNCKQGYGKSRNCLTKPLQWLPGMNQTKEPPLSGHFHSEAETMAPDDSTARDVNQEMCQEVIKTQVKSWMVDNCNEVAYNSSIISQNTNQSIADRPHGEANSKRQWPRDSEVPVSLKIGSSSCAQGVKVELLCLDNDDVPLPCYPVLGMQPLQRLTGMDVKKELSESGHFRSEAEPMTHDDSTTRIGNQERCQKVRKVKCWVADNCNEVADTSLVTSRNTKHSIVDQLHGEANSMRQRSRDSEVPISQKTEGPSSSTQQGVKFLSSEQMVPKGHQKTPDAMVMMNNIAATCPKEEALCDLQIITNSKKIVDVSRSKFSPSSQYPMGHEMPISWKSAGPSSCGHPDMTCDLSAFMPAPKNSNPSELITSSLILRPHAKVEILTRLPQNPHFSKLMQDCHPEFREGSAVGLMISFANLAESIQNMRIQDDDQVFHRKLSSLSELEANGFEVGPLRSRLENLLYIKNHQMDLKGKKEILEQNILEKEGAYNGVVQQLTMLDIGIRELEEMLLNAQEKKALLVEQRAAKGSEIAELRVDARRAEESFMSTECDFRPGKHCLLNADNRAC